MLERNSTQYSSPIQIQKMAESVPKEINIYNQAYLIQNTPLLKTEVFHPKTALEIPLSFELEGELKGHILCYLNMNEKEISEGQFHFFQSLYIESMNIVLGKFLTNLEQKADIMSILSHPELHSKKLEQIESNNENYEKFSWTYKLISHVQEFNCRVMILVERS